LTVRHGSKVERERLGTLDEAISTLRERAERVRGEGPVEPVKVLREFDPEEQVAARLEISTPRVLRSRDAGVDVKGDGTLVAYRGAIFKRPIELREGQSVYDAVREVLEED
jgi:hypothetical protein